MPFGCHVLDRPSTKKLAVFGPRVYFGLLLWHKDGAIYRILTDAGTVRTKHVRFKETEFSGMTLLLRGTQSDNWTNDGFADLFLDYSREYQPSIGQNDAVADEEDADDDVFNEALTHISTLESTFEVTRPASESDHLDDNLMDKEHED